MYCYIDAGDRSGTTCQLQAEICRITDSSAGRTHADQLADGQRHHTSSSRCLGSSDESTSSFTFAVDSSGDFTSVFVIFGFYTVDVAIGLAAALLSRKTVLRNLVLPS